jgi:hypothetical protein
MILERIGGGGMSKDKLPPVLTAKQLKEIAEVINSIRPVIERDIKELFRVKKCQEATYTYFNRFVELKVVPSHSKVGDATFTSIRKIVRVPYTKLIEYEVEAKYQTRYGYTVTLAESKIFYVDRGANECYQYLEVYPNEILDDIEKDLQEELAKENLEGRGEQK